MQTRFDAAQLTDPSIASSEGVIRKCVHCGFCTATCPTYVLLGDERDSPRGRIYLIKEMLETNADPTPDVVKHIDRCLSCLACTTTCPSGVNYGRLIDHARRYVEDRYRRPLMDRFWRTVLGAVLPRRRTFGLALSLAPLARPFSPLLARVSALRPAAAMLALAPRRRARAPLPRQADTAWKGRVLMLRGCAEPVLAPQIQAAAVRLLNRMGFKAEFLDGESCCGALSHHMGQEAAGVAFARRNLKLWTREIDKGDVAAVLTTASGCGVMLKDYGFIFRDEPEAEAAATLSRLACDISEFLEREGLPERVERPAVSVAYHAACSLQHGQKIIQAPKKLLAAAGFVVRDVREGHLCCGSAGTYNILQPEISSQLLDRKLVNIEATQADVVAAGNIGCLTQIASRAKQPVIHTVELLDWATGGPRPQALSDMTGVARPAVQARAPRPGQRDERKVIPS